jgi:hypothetical protein
MADFLDDYSGDLVVCELSDLYIAIGRLVDHSTLHLRLEEVDLHDHREANSTKDVYLIETKRYGIRANRARVDIPRGLLVAICRLDDVKE